MTPPDSSTHPSKLSFKLRMEVESICADFEDRWSSEATDLIEEALRKAPPSLRSHLVTELIGIECEFRELDGNTPIREEYVERFPNDTADVNAGFDLWQQLTKAKQTPLETPERIGNYRVIREIGRGGTGVVYEAIQDGLDRSVALKTLLLHPQHFPKQRQRFEQESTTFARLHHENILSIYDRGEVDGLLFYSMQLVDGHSLSHFIQQAKKTGKRPDFLATPRKVAKLVQKVALALDYSHSRGILHRDIKPSNLLVDSSGHVWVADFGLAKIQDADASLTSTGDVVGTLRYLPPEAFDGTRDQRADIYGLGLTLYELLTLKPAFAESDSMKLLIHIKNNDPPAMRAEAPTIPKDLETITLKAIARDAGERYPTAREFADDLQRFLARHPIHARRTGWAERAWKFVRRYPIAAGLATLLLLTIPTIALLLQGRRIEKLEADRAVAHAALEQQRADAIEAETKGIARAEKARAEGAIKARELAEYAFLTRDVQRALERGRYSAAKDLMHRYESQRPDKSHLRGWEWSYLKEQWDTASTVIASDGLSFERLRMGPNDTQFVTIGVSALNEDGTLAHAGELCFWDLETGKKQRTITVQDAALMDCDFSPDGARLATISLHNKEQFGLQGYLKLWDVESGKLLRSTELQHDYPASRLNQKWDDVKQFLPRVQFAAGGSKLVTSTPIVVFDADTLTPLWHKDGNDAVLFPDQTTVGILNQTTLFLHNLETGEEVSNQPKISYWQMHDTSPSADGNVFSTLRDNGTGILFWEFTGQNLSRRTNNFKKSTWAMISPDAKRFARSDPTGEVQLQNMDQTGEVVNLIGHEARVPHGAFTRDSKTLITADVQGIIRIWNLDRPRNPATFNVLKNLGSPLENISFDASGKRIQYVNSNFYSDRPADRTKSGWFAIDGSAEEHRKIDTTNFLSYPRTDLAYSDDGSLLAAPAREENRPDDHTKLLGCPDDGKIHIWDTASGDILQTIELGERFVTSLRWSQDNGKLAIGTIIIESPTEQQATVAIVEFSAKDQTTGQVEWLPVDGAVMGMCFTPESDQLAVAGSFGVSMIRLEPNGNSSQLITSENGVGHTFLDIDRWGKRIAIANTFTNVVRVLDLETNELLYDIALISPCCARFSPAGTRLAIVGQHSKVELCDATSGHRLLLLDGRSDMRPATPGISATVVFSKDGRQIATQAPNGRITVWKANLQP